MERGKGGIISPRDGRRGGWVGGWVGGLLYRVDGQNRARQMSRKGAFNSFSLVLYLLSLFLLLPLSIATYSICNLS